MLNYAISFSAVQTIPRNHLKKVDFDFPNANFIVHPILSIWNVFYVESLSHPMT